MMPEPVPKEDAAVVAATTVGKKRHSAYSRTRCTLLFENSMKRTAKSSQGRRG